MASAIPTGIYRHFKGNEYRVLGTGRHSETGEVLVIYKALYGDFETWVRPLAMFCEEIERNGKRLQRFQLIAGQGRE
jgi:hypothetical protein